MLCANVLKVNPTMTGNKKNFRDYARMEKTLIVCSVCLLLFFFFFPLTLEYNKDCNLCGCNLQDKYWIVWLGSWITLSNGLIWIISADSNVNSIFHNSKITLPEFIIHLLHWLIYDTYSNKNKKKSMIPNNLEFGSAS